MITQYQLGLEPESTGGVSDLTAYQLYAWLLEQLPFERAEHYHNENTHFISQYLNGNSWTVSLFGEEAEEEIGNILTRSKDISLNAGYAAVKKCTADRVCGIEDFLDQGRKVYSRKCRMEFLSPISFKQGGRYVIFPQEELILQNLLMRWNEIAGDFSMHDEDMYREMIHGIHIVDYKLRSDRFHLKNTLIPCCTGRLFIEAKLPVVLQEIWGALLSFAPYSGVGIKTTLGMGGCRIYF